MCMCMCVSRACLAKSSRFIGGKLNQ
jgi:hypothetical protein